MRSGRSVNSTHSQRSQQVPEKEASGKKSLFSKRRTQRTNSNLGNSNSNLGNYSRTGTSPSGSSRQASSSVYRQPASSPGDRSNRSHVGSLSSAAAVADTPQVNSNISSSAADSHNPFSMDPADIFSRFSQIDFPKPKLDFGLTPPSNRNDVSQNLNSQMDAPISPGQQNNTAPLPPDVWRDSF